ncbi:hypothetical protein [Geofilum rubicundum]|uniref:hypothetical protein n=1 Tax=Geofilum rubicundum TaxID=472113 RepID=UPI0007820292|nr:hypothetical protein [Geofilum rubicundum]
MVEQVKHILFKTVGKLAGVTVSFVNRDDMVFHAVVLSRKRNQLVVEDSKTGITSLDELKTFLPKKCPIVINIEVGECL